MIEYLYLTSVTIAEIFYSKETRRYYNYIKFVRPSTICSLPISYKERGLTHSHIPAELSCLPQRSSVLFAFFEFQWVVFICPICSNLFICFWSKKLFFVSSWIKMNYAISLIYLTGSTEFSPTDTPITQFFSFNSQSS